MSDGCFQEGAVEEAEDARAGIWWEEVCENVGDRAAGIGEEEGGGKE